MKNDANRLIICLICAIDSRWIFVTIWRRGTAAGHLKIKPEEGGKVSQPRSNSLDVSDHKSKK